MEKMHLATGGGAGAKGVHRLLVAVCSPPAGWRKLEKEFVDTGANPLYNLNGG